MTQNLPEATTLSRRLLLSGLMGSLVVGPACAAAPEVSQRPLARAGGSAVPASADALIDQARLGGRVSYAVLDARNGAVLETRGEATGLPPASVAKAVTALYALERLGPGFRFTTRLLASGPVSGGRIQGDLILAGGGDPTLDTDRLAALARPCAPAV